MSGKLMWMTHSGRNLSVSEAEILIQNCFAIGSEALGFSSRPADGVLLEEDGYQLRSTTSVIIENDLIDLESLYGMGEVCSNQTKLVAMLMYLQMRVRNAGGELLLTLGASTGQQEIQWSSYGDLINQLSDLGFCRDTLWRHAEVLGVCEARIDLSLTDSGDTVGFYF